jgi:sodium-coupled monocarboxylate transporter 8/12
MAIGTIDYVFLALYMLFSLAVGLRANANKGKDEKDKDANEEASDLFLAGKNANWCITGVSLVSGLTSGISFLGAPGFGYKAGCIAYMLPCAVIFATPVIALVFIPFFARTGCSTSYEYVQARFSSRLRASLALTFIVRIVVYLALVLYAPALALETALGLPLWITVLSCGIFGTIVTLKGGMQAVIWTDFLQSVTLSIGAFTCFCIAMVKTDNSLHEFWDTQQRTGKFVKDFFKVDLTQDDTFYSLFFGTVANVLYQSGVDQVAVQRYLSTPDVRTSQRTAVIGGFCNVLMNFLLTSLGLALFSYYENAAAGGDPLANNKIAKADEILPYFLIHQVPHGIAGLVIAALFGTTMSVFSAGLNSAATSTVVDLMRESLGMEMSPERTVSVVRKITGLYGLVAILLAFLAQLLGQSLVKVRPFLLSLYPPPPLPPSPPARPTLPSPHSALPPSPHSALTPPTLLPSTDVQRCDGFIRWANTRCVPPRDAEPSGQREGLLVRACGGGGRALCVCHHFDCVLKECKGCRDMQSGNTIGVLVWDYGSGTHDHGGQRL